MRTLGDRQGTRAGGPEKEILRELDLSLAFSLDGDLKRMPKQKELKVELKPTLYRVQSSVPSAWNLVPKSWHKENQELSWVKAQINLHHPGSWMMGKQLLGRGHSLSHLALL